MGLVLLLGSGPDGPQPDLSLMFGSFVGFSALLGCKWVCDIRYVFC